MRENLFAERNQIAGNVQRDGFLQQQIAELAAEAERLRETPISSLSLQDFITVYQTGSRKEYEEAYFAHRRRMNLFALLSLIYPDNPAYFGALQDAIWAVLDEFTWALPAHVPPDTTIKGYKTWIDLFAAETAFALAELLQLFDHRLTPLLRERVEYEVRTRTIEPYSSGRANDWDARENNWAAVCAGSVGAAFLYLASDAEIAAVLPRLRQTMNCYLKSFGEDGACVEGLNYWIYGFGYYTYFAQLLFQYSNGAEDWFAAAKVKAIARFQQRIRLADNQTVSFSDCSGVFAHRSGLSHFLQKKYPNGVTAPDDSSALGFDGDACYRFAHVIRDYAWRDASLPAQLRRADGVEYFEQAGWYIKKTDGYEFAAKAGHNAESHNHNDIAAFQLNMAGGGVITDPGRGEYTADYFGEQRYTRYFAPSALAHSVPVVNGKQQQPGASHCGTVLEATENKLSIAFEKAYDEPGLRSALRTFDFSADAILMTDRLCFDAAPASVTEHFVLPVRPVPCGGGLRIGDVLMRYPADRVRCTIAERTFFSNYHTQKTVYLVDLELLHPGAETELTVEFCLPERQKA